MKWASVTLALLLTIACNPYSGARAHASEAAFTGDYSTGDFSQWFLVHNPDFYGPGADYRQTRSATIINDSRRGFAARFEVRSGDVLAPDKGGGERSEVMAGNEAGGTEGEIKWYQFSTKFDPAFPQNHAELGFGITNQFWGAKGASPPLAWSVGERNGFWSLVVNPQSGPASYLGKNAVYQTPMKVGEWLDVTMQVRWSKFDEVGWIKVWLNGERQAFLNGAKIYHIRTLIPGARTVRYKEGYYRHQAPNTPTGVVFHTGFRCGSGDPPL